MQAILEAGNAAPSGENCQPWHFIYENDLIEVHLVPERDTSFYGWGQRASYMANGAVVENIVLAASTFGLRCDVSYLPTSNDLLHVATIRLQKDPTIQKDLLAAYIPTRISNRKPYERRPLAHTDNVTLLERTGDHTHIAFVDDPERITALGRIGAVNEEVMLSNRELHAFFFSHINWTKDEDDRKKIGFYIKTLELPAPAVASFTIIKYWGVMSILKAIGFHRLVGRQNAATYAASSAIGGVLLDGDSPIEYVKAGRTLERLWLAATSLGISLQPLTGVLFFMLKIDNGSGEDFSPSQRSAIISAYATAQTIFATKKRIGFMFRIGYGEAPSAHASRFPLSEVATSR